MGEVHTSTGAKEEEQALLTLESRLGNGYNNYENISFELHQKGNKDTVEIYRSRNAKFI